MQERDSIGRIIKSNVNAKNKGGLHLSSTAIERD
jgi:hypothetical protein